MASFQERVRQDYPRYFHDEALALVVGPQGVQPQEKGPRLHRFASADGFGVTLAPDFLALESRTYANFDEFADRLAILLATVAEIYSPPEVTRIGLRFVNELRLPTGDPANDARQAIRGELLGIGAGDVASSVVRSEQIVQLDLGNGNSMYVRHGLAPGGTTVESPFGQADGATLQQPFYLVDIDAFRAEALPFDAAAARERAGELNDDARTFFAWAVNEDYRRGVLGQEDDR